MYQAGQLVRDGVDVAIQYKSESTHGESNVWSGLLTAQIAGTYTVGVYALSAQATLGLVGGSTSSLTVVPAATHAADCTMNITGSASTPAGEVVALLVQARDRYGNRQLHAGDADQSQNKSAFRLEVVGGPADLQNAREATDMLDGTYSLSTRLTKAGAYSLKVYHQHGGVHKNEIGGSPVQLIVQAVDMLDRLHTTLERGIAGTAASVYTPLVNQVNDNGTAIKPGSFFYIVPRDRYWPGLFKQLNTQMLQNIKSLTILENITWAKYLPGQTKNSVLKSFVTHNYFSWWGRCTARAPHCCK